MTDETETSETWTTDESGKLILHRLTGYFTGSGSDNICLLRLKYIRFQGALEQQYALQLALASDEAERLARDLLEIVAALRASAKSDAPQR